MRMMSYVVSSTIALTLVMVSPATTFAQAYQPDRNDVTQRAGFVCAATPCLLDGTVVLGAPFSAEVTTVWRPPAGSGRAELRPPRACTATAWAAFGWSRTSCRTGVHNGSS